MYLDENDPDIVVKVKNLQNAIGGGYRHNWIIDNLPSASLMETSEVSYREGFWDVLLYVGAALLFFVKDCLWSVTFLCSRLLRVGFRRTEHAIVSLKYSCMSS